MRPGRRYPCSRCGRWVTATASSLYATRRDGKLIRYVSLRTHRTWQGRACSGAHASVEPPPCLACPWNERTER